MPVLTDHDDRLTSADGLEPLGELFMPPDVDSAREFFRQKSRAMTDKRMTVREAVERFIHDGDYIAAGGFGSVRMPTAVLHEIVRTRKRNLGFLGPLLHPRFPDPGGRATCLTAAIFLTWSGWRCAGFHPTRAA